ncbi:MAG: 2-polyprenyl-6-methoxyphenol hydroxylase [Bacilli bacterium]|nr:2-polyprenyl-6-methoxyphenol hydroxylase [Bacilli bacterium]
MQPNLGQGGAQAIEDALVLSRCLQGNQMNISNALQVYEQSRIKRTSLIVRRSRMMGKLMQLENLVAIELRNTLLRTIPVRMQLKRLEWLIGYEI